jgi:hypothetical protein
MRSVTNPVLSIFSLAAVFGGAVSLAGCGGGGGVQRAGTVEVNGPALVPPLLPVIPNPHPLPPPEDDGTVPAPPGVPVEPVLPVVPPPVAPAPDLKQVRAMAYVGQVLYVGDLDGNVWQQGPDGTQWAMFATMPYGAIEAMTWVEARSSLYFVQGGRLTRLNIETRAQELLLAFGFSQWIPNFYDVTGLAFNSITHVLYGLDREQHALFQFVDLDAADTAWVMYLGFDNDGLSDLLFDATIPTDGVLRAIDAVSQQLIEIDHLGLTWTATGSAPLSVGQTIALEFARVIVGIDTAWGALVRFEANGTLIP